MNIGLSFGFYPCITYLLVFIIADLTVLRMSLQFDDVLISSMSDAFSHQVSQDTARTVQTTMRLLKQLNNKKLDRVSKFFMYLKFQ